MRKFLKRKLNILLIFILDNKISLVILGILCVVTLRMISIVEYKSDNFWYMSRLSVFIYSMFIPMLLFVLLLAGKNISDDEKNNFLFRKNFTYNINMKYTERGYTVRPLQYLLLFIFILAIPLIVISGFGLNILNTLDVHVLEPIRNAIQNCDEFNEIFSIIGIFLAILLERTFSGRASLFYVDGKTKIQRHFQRSIFCTSGCLLLFVVFYFYIKDESIYIFFVFLLFFIFSIYRIIQQICSKPYHEDYEVIKKIDHIFWQKNNIFLPHKEWDDNIALCLFHKQLDLKHKKKYLNQFEKIEKVEFHSVFSDCIDNRNQAKRNKKRFILFGSVMVVICLGVILGEVNKSSYVLVCILFLIQWLCAMIIIIQTNKEALIYNRLTTGNWQYFVKERDKGTYITNTYQIMNQTLIKEYKKIICLWNTFDQMTQDNESNFQKEMFKIWEEKMNEEIHFYGDEAKIYVTPLLVCLGLSQISGSESKKIYEIVQRIKLSEHEKRIIRQMSLALIRDLYGNDYLYEVDYNKHKKLLDLLLKM